MVGGKEVLAWEWGRGGGGGGSETYRAKVVYVSIDVRKLHRE